ncbi:ABC transporter ATP-binding protein [Flavobacterium sp.]|uniref:ABC transporter ATP-binding protein n=1 Tax=Flavobacterium sp. TaxID=239 RepID=UPI002A83F508|nr:ABC transporter ATP-binding protein [Flavobacterium sp.]
MLLVSNVSFSYKCDKTLCKVTFSIKKGQHVSILGESGSGKSTLLKVIYGLEDLNEGEIFWNETVVLGPKFNLVPGMSFMKYLAQDFDLMPYITVSENIGKFLSNFYPENKQERIKELLQLVEMTAFSDVKVKYLSGGQMQRVAIARVLALEPEILLFDEPFSHIDNSRKNNLRRSVFNYAKEKGVTCIVATHDMDDALSFSDKIIVLKNGKVIAEETPDTLFNSKDNVDVAKLFGDINVIDSVFLGELINNKQLIYPFELEITEQSKLRIEVLNSYYKGRNYLIEAKYDEGILFFENVNKLARGEQVFLKLKD